jgi:hypothetical protein
MALGNPRFLTVPLKIETSRLSDIFYPCPGFIFSLEKSNVLYILPVHLVYSFPATGQTLLHVFSPLCFWCLQYQLEPSTLGGSHL